MNYVIHSLSESTGMDSWNLYNAKLELLDTMYTYLPTNLTFSK